MATSESIWIEQGKLSDVLPDAKNANAHTLRGASTLEKSIRQRGFFRPTAAFGKGVDKPVMGAGNLTQETALNIGMDDAIFVYTDGTKPIVHVRTDIAPGSDEAKLLSVEDNRVAELSLAWDGAVLAGMDIDLGGLFDAVELTALDGWPEAEMPEDPGAQLDKAAELQAKWQTAPGQLWALGAHRLICGDCTDAAVVARVMGGEKAQLVFTDPPYGVDYDGGTKTRERLRGDTDTSLYVPACKTAASFSDDAAALYLWHAGIKGIAAAAAAAAAAAGYVIRCEIVWNKNQAQFGALSAQYKQKHEPLYYCYKRGQAPRWFGPTNEVTVWDCDRRPINEYHPTEKPVELAERAMRNSSQAGDVVADWFLGGGCTLIAAERLGRKCRGVELEPAYVAVCLERFYQMTGLAPERLAG